MTKTATVTVTIAPGCHVTEPHPSGIRELPGRTLNGGDTLTVSAETASDMLKARLILDPTTGRPVQLPAPLPGAYQPYLPHAGAVVSYGGIPKQPNGSGAAMLETHPNWAALVEPPTNGENRSPKPPPHNCTGPMIEIYRNW